MTTVYFEHGAILFAQPDDNRRRPPAMVLVPGLMDQIRYLLEARVDIRVVGGHIAGQFDALEELQIIPELPDDPPVDSWLVTSDPGWCERPRPAGLRTILIGPHKTPGPRRSTYCDVVARDLSAAVMEILTRQVMGSV